MFVGPLRTAAGRDHDLTRLARDDARLAFAPSAKVWDDVEPRAKVEMDYQMSPRAFATALLSGGDERLAIQFDGLNRYGCAPRPVRTEEFGSCTSSTISERGHLAAFDLWRVMCAEPSAAARGEFIDQKFEHVRSRLRDWLGGGDSLGDIVLTPSGTDAELIALHVAASLHKGRLRNVVVAPDEVGSGTRLAAACRHFAEQTPSGKGSRVGDAIDEVLSRSVATVGVEARNPEGRVRSDAEVEGEIEAHVREALGASEGVLVHALAHSKTGIRTPSVDGLTRLGEMGHNVMVLVDAAQGRLSKQSIIEHLAMGRLVLFTGSKFFGGPTFSGALFLPASIPAATSASLPGGYSDYFTRVELPLNWHGARSSLGERTNVGLLLRWEAALAEMHACDAVEPARQARVYRLFGELVEEVFRGHEWLRLVGATNTDVAEPTSRAPIESIPTVFNFLIRSETREWLGKPSLVRWHGWLNRPLSAFLHHGLDSREKAIADRAYHLGQPVVIQPGDREEPLAVLRIALGAPLLVDLAELGEDEARRRLRDTLTGLRSKLELIRAFSAELCCA